MRRTKKLMANPLLNRNSNLPQLLVFENVSHIRTAQRFRRNLDNFFWFFISSLLYFKDISSFAWFIFEINFDI